MKFKAIKECPQGQQPGEIFEAEEDAGAVLESVGAAVRVVEPDGGFQDFGAGPAAPLHDSKKTKYKRRDLQAED